MAKHTTQAHIDYKKTNTNDHTQRASHANTICFTFMDEKESGHSSSEFLQYYLFFSKNLQFALGEKMGGRTLQPKGKNAAAINRSVARNTMRARREVSVFHKK